MKDQIKYLNLLFPKENNDKINIYYLSYSHSITVIWKYIFYSKFFVDRYYVIQYDWIRMNCQDCLQFCKRNGYWNQTGCPLN